MEALMQNICVPENHHIHLDFTLPESVPKGDAELLLIVQPKQASDHTKNISFKTGAILKSTDNSFKLPSVGEVTSEPVQYQSDTFAPLNDDELSDWGIN